MMVSNNKSILERLAERDGRCCHYCERPLHVEEMTKDHVIPARTLRAWRRASIKFPEGYERFRNFVLACKPCNMAKNDTGYENFMSLPFWTREELRKKFIRDN